MTNGLRSPVQWLRWIASNTKRLAVLLVGSALVGAGLAMLVLPGPGAVVSLLGLAVLATEFAWAERALDRSKAKAVDVTNKMTASALSRLSLAVSAGGLIVGGAVAVALSRQYRAVGLGALVAGITATALLFPQTTRWLNAHVQPRSVAPDDGAAPSEPKAAT